MPLLSDLGSLSLGNISILFGPCISGAERTGAQEIFVEPILRNAVFQSQPRPPFYKNMQGFPVTKSEQDCEVSLLDDVKAL